MIRLFAILLAVLSQGCVYFNEDGVSTRYYRDCVEYYDAQGVHHCECDKNLADYKEIPLKKEGAGREPF